MSLHQRLGQEVGTRTAAGDCSVRVVAGAGVTLTARLPENPVPPAPAG